MRRRTLAVLWLLFLAPIACTPPRSAKTGTPSVSATPVALLRSDLNRLFSDARLRNAQVGVEVYSPGHSEIVYEKDSSKLLLPASNNKILTVCAALLRLGPDFRIPTRVLTDGPVENGVMTGNLIIAGSGDPTNSARFHSGDPFSLFKDWAARIKAMNVRRIAGDIIADEGDFVESPGRGWEWNDLVESFAAPVSALQFDDNTVSLEISPGNQKGDPAIIHALPIRDFLKLDNEAVTDQDGTSPHIEICRLDDDQGIEVKGTIPRSSEAITRMVAVRDPVRYYLWALRNTLSAEGIDVSACALKKSRSSCNPGSTLLWADESPPLSAIIKPLLKTSQNLYAETLARVLGSGKFSNGREVVEDTLGGIGIEKGSYCYADGSGLSRLNLISPDALVRLLRFMAGQPEFAFFDSALPIAGVDGTLADRMKGTKAENNVHAKTGSMTGVSSISGYVRDSDGEMLVFSIIYNNFLASRDMVEEVQDKALERLANFSRK